jgi:hypothetical protein
MKNYDGYRYRSGVAAPPDEKKAITSSLVSNETCRRISEAHTGIPLSEEPPRCAFANLSAMFF